VGLARAPDAEVVDRARTDSSVVVTFDLDFGDILALAERLADLESGALILVEDTRYRVRKRPIGR
jgi:hypothetical protein